MGGLTAILRCQWRAYWRRFARSGNLNAGNQGILLIISVLISIRYVRALGVVSTQLSVGKSSMLERLLLGIFLVWLFPLMSNARLSIATRALKHLPLDTNQLFIIKSVSLLIPPFSWLIILGSLAIGYPLLSTPEAVPAIVGSLLFIVFSWLAGLTLAQLLSVALWRRLMLVMVTLLAFAGAYSAATRGWAEVAAIRFFPATLVANAAVGKMVWRQLLMLGVLVALAAWVARWSFKLSLETVETRAARGSRSFSLFPGKTGPLSAKDFRYFRRLFDPYLGLLASGLGCFYFVVAEVPTAEIFWIFILVVFFPNATLTFNAFGLDSNSATDRYALLPLSGQEIVWSKNQAYVATMIVQLFPLFGLAALRLGVVATSFGVIEVLLLMFAYATWGNLIAISHRFKMQFYRFSSGGSPIDALVGVLFGTLPGAIAIQLFQWPIWWVSLLMLILYGGLYWASLIRAGRQFERRLGRV